MAKQGIAPNVGGSLDQPNLFIQVVGVLNRCEAEHTEAEHEAAKARSKVEAAAKHPPSR